MVGGLGIAVTNVPLVSQCAEIQRIAFGFGSVLPSSLQFCTNSFSLMAFIGLPRPIKSTGIRTVLLPDDAKLFSSLFIALTVIGRRIAELINDRLFIL